MIRTTTREIANTGWCEDLTNASMARCYEVRKKKGFEVLKYSTGVYGVNALLMVDADGNYYKTTHRCQNNYILM